MSLSTAQEQQAPTADDVLDWRWRVKVGNRIYGPYTGHHMLRYICEGRIVPYSCVKPVEGGEWRQASADDGLALLFARAHRQEQSDEEAARVPRPELKPRSKALCQMLNEREEAGAETTQAVSVTPASVEEPESAPEEQAEQTTEPATETPATGTAVVPYQGDEGSTKQAVSAQLIGDLVDREAIAAMTVHALRHVLHDPADPIPPSPDETSGAPVSPLVVIANLQASSREEFEGAVQMLGTAREVKPGIWMLNAPFAPAKVRNHLIQCLGVDDEIYVIDAKSGRIAWFNLAPESDCVVKTEDAAAS